MYVSPISTRFVRGRSTPEIRAILVLRPWSLDLSPVAAYVSDWGRSRAPHHGGARSCTCHKSVELMHALSWGPFKGHPEGCPLQSESPQTTLLTIRPRWKSTGDSST